MVADIAARISADLYHVHEPELLGPVLNRVGNRPVIYDVHESFLDVLGQREWIPRPFRPLAKSLWQKNETSLVRKCRAIITVGEPIAERYLRIHGCVEIIRNFPDLSSGDFSGVPVYDRKQACVFAGILKKDRNLENIVLAIGLLRKRNMALPLWLAGRWASDQYEREIWKLAAEEGVVDLLHYSGLLSHKDALTLVSRASIGMVTLLPIQNNLKALPVKMFECMALGLPVIYSNFPLLQTYVREYGVGLAVDPEKPEQIADALECLLKNPQMATNMGQMGKLAATKMFNWANERSRLCALYRNILDQRISNA
jgi:glycosyltransferase involved in cell wall biosynthesis